VKKFFAGLALAAAVAAPIASFAATVDSSLIPDGTYTVKVEKVVDIFHMTVLMDNGMETTVVAGGSINFSPIRPSETIKLSLIKGKVPVFVQVIQ
jgi:hypothetical protein